MMKQQSLALVCIALALVVAVETVSGVITVQIGGATRLNSANRQRGRYNCYWDCDLVSCDISRDDDECAYDCEKICRVRYDFASAAATSAVGRSGADQSNSLVELMGKSAASAAKDMEIAAELNGAGTSVRLHMPRNASTGNFAIWERCYKEPEVEGSSGAKVIEKPFNL